MKTLNFSNSQNMNIKPKASIDWRTRHESRARGGHSGGQTAAVLRRAKPITLASPPWEKDIENAAK